MNYFRKYSSNFGLKYDFLSSMVVNDKCWLYFKFKTICFLLNKHKKYVTNSCCTHHFQLFDTFRKFSTNQNFRKCNSIRNGFDTPSLRHHIACVAFRWLYGAYIHILLGSIRCVVVRIHSTFYSILLLKFANFQVATNSATCSLILCSDNSAKWKQYRVDTRSGTLYGYF